MEKKCTKCKEVKSLDEFSNDKRLKSGKQSKCKNCDNEYYENNIKKIKLKHKEYYIKNKKEINVKVKNWVKNNQEKYKEYSVIYRKNNTDKSNSYFRIRKKTDNLFKLSCDIRSLIGITIKNQGYKKNTKTYNILQCEYDFFMIWLNGMASNGYAYGTEDLHLDHVIPISLANTEKETISLNHYSNFQLLNAHDNISKGNRYVNPLNLARVLEHHPNPDKIREIHARL